MLLSTAPADVLKFAIAGQGRGHAQFIHPIPMLLTCWSDMEFGWLRYDLEIEIERFLSAKQATIEVVLPLCFTISALLAQISLMFEP